MTEDLTTVADSDLHRQIDAIQAELQRRLAEAVQEKAVRDVAIADSIAALTALIGPDAPTTASTNSLTEVQLYTNAQLAANAGLAHRLTFVALERLARTVRDIARAKTED